VRFESIWTRLLEPEEQSFLAPGIPSDLNHTPDVLILGGGIIGLSIARYISHEHSLRTVLLEQNTLASGATSANAGGIFAGQQHASLPASFRNLGIASRDLYFRWSSEAWADFELRKTGSLSIASERFSEGMSTYTEQECSSQRNAQHLDSQTLRQLFPLMSNEIKEAIYYPDDGHLNPMKTALSFARASYDCGVQLTTGVTVHSLQTSRASLQCVVTNAGDFYPGTLIVCGGWNTAQLTRDLNISLPITPAKGQLMATDPVPFSLQCSISGRQVLIQLSDRRILAGGTVEHVGENYEVNSELSHTIRQEAVRVVPCLNKVDFTQVWTGLRPCTPDERPVIDRHPLFKNVFLAAGHYKTGILLAPVTGKVISELVLDGKTSHDISDLQLTRFQNDRNHQ
tara:strand:+ start:108 stop:1304 length:1197 start_codon:yes stop_codon:yes gene_type:complete